MYNIPTNMDNTPMYGSNNGMNYMPVPGWNGNNLGDKQIPYQYMPQMQNASQIPSGTEQYLFPMRPMANSNIIQPDSGTQDETLTNPAYLPAILKRYIRKIMRIEFLINDELVDKLGRLLAVGANYLVLQTIEPSVVMICDLYSLKFATVVTVDKEELPI